MKKRYKGYFKKKTNTLFDVQFKKLSLKLFSYGVEEPKKVKKVQYKRWVKIIADRAKGLIRNG